MWRTGNRFYIFSGLVLLFILVVENINGRFWLNDFKVYYGAAKAFVEGDRVYGIPFGEDTGLYKYAPFLLFVFAPATLLPFQLAAVTHFIICSICLVSLLSVLYRLFSEIGGLPAGRTSLILTLAFMVLLNHIFRELHLGNVNIPLILLLTLTAGLALKGRETAAGWIFAICIFFKPYFLLLSLPLFLSGKLRTLVHAAIASFCFLIVCVILMGFQDAVWMHREWLSSMRNHSEFLDSNHTLAAILQQFSGLRLAVTAPLFLFVTVTIILLRSRRRFRVEGSFFFLLAWFVYLAMIPSLVITDTNHFLMAAPLILLLMMFLPHLNSKKAAVLVILSFLMYGANSPEIFGSHLSDQIERHGILGISNILIILLAIWAWNDWCRQRREVHT